MPYGHKSLALLIISLRGGGGGVNIVVLIAGDLTLSYKSFKNHVTLRSLDWLKFRDWVVFSDSKLT